MAFTEKDQAEQQKAFEEIKDEFSRLTAQFDAMLKEGGLRSEDLQQALGEKHTPEAEAFLAKAKDDAARAGQARAAQAAPAAGRAPVAGRGRPGVVRL